MVSNSLNTLTTESSNLSIFGTSSLDLIVPIVNDIREMKRSV